MAKKRSGVISRPRVVLVNRCFVKDKRGRLLIIRRSSNDKNNAGKWEVPGGKLDVGQDLSHAQEREVLKETGLLVSVLHPYSTTESFTIGDGQYKGLAYVALFHITQVVGGTFALSEEHTDHAWVSYRELMKYDLTHEVRKAAITLRKYLI